MAEILLCNQLYRPDGLEGVCGICPNHIRDIGGFAPSVLIPYRPYLLSEKPTGTDRSILVVLNHHHISQDITDMALALGDDITLAIAEIAAGLRDYGAGAMGAATGIYAKRMEAFAGAVRQYQEALLDYRDAVKSNPAARAVAEQKAVGAFQNMQKGFQNEVSTITSRIHAHRGTALGSSTRALNIARSSRNIVKLNVLDLVQADNLAKFGRYGRFFGNGLVAIDFGSRVGNVHNSYKVGDNWEREMFIESNSFAAGAITGVIAAGAGSSALFCLAVLTPPGWVLIIAGIAAAGVAAGASISMDKYAKENSGEWYDKIMKWMGIL